LYEGTIALDRRKKTLGRNREDLSLDMIAVDLDGRRRL